jgi:hypothetical protein
VLTRRTEGGVVGNAASLSARLGAHRAQAVLAAGLLGDCEAGSRCRAAAESYAKSAPLHNDRGHLTKNPLHQVVRDNADHVRLVARERGLSPAARASLPLVPGAQTPEIDAELGAAGRGWGDGSSDLTHGAV